MNPPASPTSAIGSTGSASTAANAACTAARPDSSTGTAMHARLGAERRRAGPGPVQGHHGPAGGEELGDDGVPEGARRPGDDHCWVHRDILPGVG